MFCIFNAYADNVISFLSFHTKASNGSSIKRACSYRLHLTISGQLTAAAAGPVKAQFMTVQWLASYY